VIPNASKEEGRQEVREEEEEVVQWQRRLRSSLFRSRVRHLSRSRRSAL